MAAAPSYRPRCFFDVDIDNSSAGRITFELFSDICPKTCENFRALCTGEKGLGQKTGKPLHYKGVIFHRVVKDFMVQSGDFSAANGTGGESIFGGTFEDECFERKHDRPMLLSMANRGKNTNGSQFFITTKPAPHLDGVHVVFGHVITGAEVVTQIENLPTDGNSRPTADVKIANCGELVLQLKPKTKKKKQTVETSDSENESSSDDADAEKKKEKSRSKKKKKEKQKEQKSSESESEEGQLGETPNKPDLTYSSVRPEEIPNVPANNFLMRSIVEEQKPPERIRRRSQPVVTRSGRKIKGRGSLRYRTPSRSRSRSYTPPHWREATRGVMSLEEYKEVQRELQVRKKAREEREAERQKRDNEREARRTLEAAEFARKENERNRDQHHSSRSQKSLSKENVNSGDRPGRFSENAREPRDSRRSRYDHSMQEENPNRSEKRVGRHRGEEFEEVHSSKHRHHKRSRHESGGGGHEESKKLKHHKSERRHKKHRHSHKNYDSDAEDYAEDQVVTVKQEIDFPHSKKDETIPFLGGDIGELPRPEKPKGYVPPLQSYGRIPGIGSAEEDSTSGEDERKEKENRRARKSKHKKHSYRKHKEKKTEHRHSFRREEKIDKQMEVSMPDSREMAAAFKKRDTVTDQDLKDKPRRSLSVSRSPSSEGEIKG